MGDLIGNLRHRMILEELVPQGDSAGGFDEVWQEVDELWGQIKAASGGEIQIGDKRLAHITHKIMIRFRSDITPRQRLRHLNEIFTIEAILDEAGRGKFLTLLCRYEDLR